MKNTFLIFVFIVIPVITGNQKEAISRYEVKRISSPPEINAVWDKMPWSEIEPLQLKEYMGDKPGYIPFTQAKMAYDDFAVYVIFRVEDRYIKAVHNKNQDPVYLDSCVEFFFTPGGDIKNGYFNLEMNCGGTMLFHHQMKPRTDRAIISEDHIQKIDVAHTLPEIIDPEIDKETTWLVEYRIPFSVLSNYHSFTKPEAGSVWRANFYKCADETSHPHWLTWAPVDFSKPNFHLPQFFGLLEFQE